MIREVLPQASSIRFVDLEAPTRDELNQLAREYDLPVTLVEDCLDPAHLPKWEELKSGAFLIFRFFDERVSEKADTVQALTRKVAFFCKPRVLGIIHRKDQAFLAQFRAQVLSENPKTETEILLNVLKEGLKTYLAPLENWYLRLEKLESKAFGAKNAEGILREGYYLRRKVSVIKRLLRMSNDVLRFLKSYPGVDPLQVHELIETVDRLYFLADEIFDNVNQLLSLEISLASQRTNEVMRVLTVFSAFFLPLSFIAGIYGMNFQHMPELSWPYGYALSIGIMASVALSIFIWFKRRGWL